MAFKPKFANKLKTPKGRFIYPHLDKVDSTGTYADNKYKVQLLIPKEADLRSLKNACLALAKETWGDDVDAKKVKFPFRDGDKKTDEEGEIYNGFEGHYYVTVKTKKKPLIVDRARERMDADLIKGGDYGRLSVSAMSYESTKDVEIDGETQSRKLRGVTLLLEGVQFLEEGDPLGGGGGASASDFDDGEFAEESAVGSSASSGDGLDDIMG